MPHRALSPKGERRIDQTIKRSVYDEWYVATEYVKQLKRYKEALVLNGFLIEREVNVFAQFHAQQDRAYTTPRAEH